MVIAEKEMRIAIFHLQHVAKFVMTVVKSELLPKPKEIAFLNTEAPDQVVVRPFASRKAKRHRNRKRPVVTRLDGHDILAIFAGNGNISIG